MYGRLRLLLARAGLLLLAALSLFPPTGQAASGRPGGMPPGVTHQVQPKPEPPRIAPVSSRMARRESMREAGIPTSQQPVKQISTPAGRQLHYQLPTAGGGSRKMVVTNQTTDRVPGHGKHWEAGAAKVPERTDPLGRTRVSNTKAKVNYGS